MIYNEYILLNGIIFFYNERKPYITKFGSGLQRTLNATAYQDQIAKKKSWDFTIEGDNKVYLRLKNIFENGGEIAFTDYDNATYTVLWSDNSFSPTDMTKDGREWYGVSFKLEEK